MLKLDSQANKIKMLKNKINSLRMGQTPLFKNPIEEKESETPQEPTYDLKQPDKKIEKKEITPPVKVSQTEKGNEKQKKSFFSFFKSDSKNEKRNNSSFKSFT